MTTIGAAVQLRSNEWKKYHQIEYKPQREKINTAVKNPSA